MPTSHPDQLNEIVNAIGFCDPQTLLDIGCGRGKYGLLAREYLEEWNGGRRRIDAIEVYREYVNDVTKAVYDTVYVGGALDLLPTLQEYDLYLLIDVIEHLTKADGDKLLAACNGIVLVSTPKEFAEQDAVNGNEHERHLSHWTISDFKKHGAVRSIPNDRSLICLIRKDKA